MQPAETIDALIQRYATEAVRASFSINFAGPRPGAHVQLMHLGSTQRLIDEAIRQAFNAGAVYGMSHASQPITVIAGQPPRPAPVRGPYPPVRREP